MDNNEQWKSSGDCSICRRKNYCKTPCTASKRKYDASVRRVVVDAMVASMTGEDKLLNNSMGDLLDNMNTMSKIKRN